MDQASSLLLYSELSSQSQCEMFVVHVSQEGGHLETVIRLFDLAKKLKINTLTRMLKRSFGQYFKANRYLALPILHLSMEPSSSFEEGLYKTEKASLPKILSVFGRL
eukprot:TRINITY_DN8270_c0_g1_i6.p1 TRINITY_DN8270_c0_g1~~TRINITY_DN8270_c0_g1_i6.p1  ORF type:complete len:107 (+),score=0.68 TRINITY_DN8270_c0_g1_i6:212-532(+)